MRGSDQMREPLSATVEPEAFVPALDPVAGQPGTEAALCVVRRDRGGPWWCVDCTGEVVAAGVVPDAWLAHAEMPAMQMVARGRQVRRNRSVACRATMAKTPGADNADDMHDFVCDDRDARRDRTCVKA